MLETHSSVIFLIGALVFKLKKPVDLGFLDWTSRPARQLACSREVELNRRLAPDVYLIERSSKETLKVLRRRKATKDLAAVRSGRVLILNDRLVEPDQDAYRALELIARFLHPESLP